MIVYKNWLAYPRYDPKSNRFWIKPIGLDGPIVWADDWREIKPAFTKAIDENLEKIPLPDYTIEDYMAAKLKYCHNCDKMILRELICECHNK